VLAAGGTAIDLYVDPHDRMMLSARWASGLRRLAGLAEPGSDWQLAFTRAWAAVAASPEHVDELWWLLDTTDGGEILPGLRVDTDLRWCLLQRLVVLGVAADAHIDAELVRDDTATGRRQAAYARAARPTERAKADAWAQAMESDKLPNAILRATVEGFHQPEHRELVRPYVGRYLDAIPQLWADRTTETARTIIVRMFPRLLADPDIADTIRDWLDRADLPAAPRRLVVEGLADMERALRAQARDRTAGQAARRR
jgi:aminopeptidase N